MEKIFVSVVWTLTNTTSNEDHSPDHAEAAAQVLAEYGLNKSSGNATQASLIVCYDRWHILQVLTRPAHLEVYRHDVIKRVYFHCRKMVSIRSEAFHIPEDSRCGSQVFSVRLNSTFTGLANTEIGNWLSVSWRGITLLQHSIYWIIYRKHAGIAHSHYI